MSKVDLHIHSNYSSDGDFSPGQLVAQCLDAGLTHTAIADHNAVRGVAEALHAADGTPLMIIPAIEMDCVLDGVNLHLLGYGIDYHAPVFDQIEEEVHQQEQEASALLMRLVRQLGIDFNDGVIAELAYDGVVTGEMICEAALIFDREAKNPLLDPYRSNGTRSDNPYVNFYWDYCSQGKPAYTPFDYISLTQAIEIIQSHHGVPVLAHPGVNVKEDPALLEEVIAAGISGLEVFSSYHNQDQVRFYQNAARSHDILMTCGSDFHGKTKKTIQVGGVDCAGLEDQIITALLDRISQS